MTLTPRNQPATTFSIPEQLTMSSKRFQCQMFTVSTKYYLLTVVAVDSGLFASVCVVGFRITSLTTAIHYTSEQLGVKMTLSNEGTHKSTGLHSNKRTPSGTKVAALHSIKHTPSSNYARCKGRGFWRVRWRRLFARYVLSFISNIMVVSS